MASGLNPSANYVIHSENLAALQTLQSDLTEKVKCIYIDPPYNSFTLNDPIRDAAREDKWFNDSMDSNDWLKMMRDRITLSREMLQEDGTFWVSINDCELPALRSLCNEIFSKQNHLMTVIWEKGGVLDDLTPYLAESHDYVLCYGKNRAVCEPELKEKMKKIGCGTIWKKEEVGSTFDALREVAPFNEKVFPTPKPEGLIHRIITVATNSNDLVLDYFGGSGTTGAVAHKMDRRWIIIEQENQCLTHIVPRIEAVIHGRDAGGISKLVNWQGGGSYQLLEPSPSSIKQAV